MAAWRLTTRIGPRVARARFDTLEGALADLERRLEEVGPQAHRDAVQVLRRRFEPVRQVVARGEISGPGRVLPATVGGVDLRGDGSSEAFTGRWRRALVEAEAGESAYQALGRVLSARS